MLIKHLAVFVITFLTLVILLLVAMDYGIFFSSKIMYPFAMLMAIPKQNFNTLEIIIAFIQNHIYLIILTSKPKWKYYLIAIHVIAIIFVFIIPDNTFTP